MISVGGALKITAVCLRTAIDAKKKNQGNKFNFKIKNYAGRIFISKIRFEERHVLVQDFSSFSFHSFFALESKLY